MDQACSDHCDEKKRMESLIDSLERHADLEEGCSGSHPISVPMLQHQVEHETSLDTKTRLREKIGKGKETVKKRTNGLFHMIRVLGRNGLCVDSFCDHVDSDRSGTIRKAHFAKILKNIGFPFTWKDLNEILLRYANAPKFDIVDYESFLNDAGVSSKAEKIQLDFDLNIKISLDTGWRKYTGVILNVKRMLIDTVINLDRMIDEIYGMFAVWDITNTGTVTATQFLRVLVRLKVELSDQDQDFLVDLLDTTSMGRIDYECLMDFCFSGFDPLIINTLRNDALSEIGSNNDCQQSTARNDQCTPRSGSPSPTQKTPRPFSSNAMDTNKDCSEMVLNTARRPTTAFARIPSSENCVEKSHAEGNESLTKNPPQIIVGDFPKSPYSFKDRMRSASMFVLNNPDVEIDISDQIDFDSRIKVGFVSNAESRSDGLCSAGSDSLSGGRAIFEGDIESIAHSEASSYFHLNSSALILEANELNLCVGKEDESPYSSIGMGSNVQDSSAKIKRGRWEGLRGEYESDISDYDSWSRQKRDNVLSPLETYPYLNKKQIVLSSIPLEARCAAFPDAEGNLQLNPLGTFIQGTLDSPTYSVPEPTEHLNFLASQTLAAVRDMVLTRHKTGKLLSVIFRHFDRVGRNYFDAKDFMTATADLRIETAENVAILAVAQIALDGRDSVTYGEFQVYVLDPHHHTLESAIITELSDQFEKHGRGFQTTLLTAFWTEDKSVTDKRQKEGFVSKIAFISVLKKLGLQLTSRDVDRLVGRFDINNEGTHCSASRFIKMVERSESWILVEEGIAHHEGALKEASILRAEITGKKNKPHEGSFGGRRLTDGMISMAESLGIKVISEQYLLWIVRDALNLPLPVPWTLVKHITGKTCYFNGHTGRSQWEHPLEPHFKELRDKHRNEREVEIIPTGLPAYCSKSGLPEQKSAPQTFYHGFTDPLRPFISDFGSDSSNQQIFLSEKSGKDKKVRGLNCNHNGTWHLPVQQGNPFNPYNTFNSTGPGLGSGASGKVDIEGKEMKLPGLSISLKNSMSNANTSTPFLLRHPLSSPAQLTLSDTHLSQHGATIAIGSDLNLFSPVRIQGNAQINFSTNRKEVKKKSVASTGHQNKAGKGVNTTFKSVTSGFKQPLSVVDRLMNISKASR